MKRARGLQLGGPPPKDASSPQAPPPADDVSKALGRLADAFFPLLFDKLPQLSVGPQRAGEGQEFNDGFFVGDSLSIHVAGLLQKLFKKADGTADPLKRALIVDVGSGNGYTAVNLAASLRLLGAAPQYHVLGVEIDPARAKESLHAIDMLRGGRAFLPKRQGVGHDDPIRDVHTIRGNILRGTEALPETNPSQKAGAHLPPPLHHSHAISAH